MASRSVDESSHVLASFLGALGIKQANEAAWKLLKEFGSLAELLAASEERLARHAGQRTAACIAKASQLMRYATRAELLVGPILGSTTAVLAHARAELANLRSEQVLVIFLDTRNRLVRSEVIFRGSLNAAPFQTREIVARALELNAASLIIAHNHPSGDPEPSAADVQCTRTLCASLRGLGISLLDHLVVGKEGETSLRTRGYL